MIISFSYYTRKFSKDKTHTNDYHVNVCFKTQDIPLKLNHVLPVTYNNTNDNLNLNTADNGRYVGGMLCCN